MFWHRLGKISLVLQINVINVKYLRYSFDNLDSLLVTARLHDSFPRRAGSDSPGHNPGHKPLDPGSGICQKGITERRAAPLAPPSDSVDPPPRLGVTVGRH